MERADQVLSRGQIDGGLSPYRGVHLTDQGRGYLDESDTSQIDRRRKTREVRHGAPADAHHDVRA